MDGIAEQISSLIEVAPVMVALLSLVDDFSRASPKVVVYDL